MSCELYRQLASDQIDGAATTEETATLADHTAHCGNCAAHLDDLSSLQVLLGELNAGDGPAARFVPPADSRIGWAYRRLAGHLQAASEWLTSTSGRAIAALLLAATLAPLMSGGDHPRESPPPIALMTVWDSSAERIVASCAGEEDWSLPAPRAYGAAETGVRIFFFERIVVRG